MDQRGEMFQLRARDRTQAEIRFKISKDIDKVRNKYEGE